jgi:hypothetical protein
MIDPEQYAGTAFVLLAYLAEKSKKEGNGEFPLKEVIEDFRKIRASCPDTHLLSPDFHLSECLAILKHPLSLVDYNTETVSIGQMGVTFGERKKIPENCRQYIQKEWGD